MINIYYRKKFERGRKILWPLLLLILIILYMLSWKVFEKLNKNRESILYLIAGFAIFIDQNISHKKVS